MTLPAGVPMGRRETPLDTQAGLAQAFAADLRDLRRRAGGPTYQAMSARARCSKSALSAAASGDGLPSLAVTLAYVQACGGNVSHWERRWHMLARLLDRVPKRVTSTHANGGPSDSSLTVATVEIGRHGPWRSLTMPRGLLPDRVRGRTTLVDSLRQLIELPDGRMHVLCGMGGSGKTTVALSVAAGAAADRHVWWINARDATSLSSGLVDLALAVGVTADEIKQAAAGAQSLTDLVWRQLDTMQEPWLLVVDNADAPELLAAEGGVVRDGNGMVRGSNRGLVLVTSRVRESATWGERAVLHPVNVLDVDDAALMLRDLAPSSGNTTEAALVAARLGGLPLALRAAGRYLGSAVAQLDRVTTFTDYLHAADARFKTLLGDTTGSVGPRDVVMTTWELSLDWLAAQGLPEARAFMRLIGGFAPAPIPVNLLDRLAIYDSRLFDPDLVDRQAPRGVAQRIRECASERLRRTTRYDENLHRRVITSLCGLGLLELTEVGTREEAVTCLTAHPLVSEVNAAWVADDRRLARRIYETASFLLSRVTPGREPSDSDEYPRWAVLAPHLTHLLTQTIHALSRTSTVELINAATTTSQGLNQAGDYPTALRVSAVAVAAANRTLQDDDPGTLTARYQVGVTLSNQGQLQRAEAELQALLPAASRITGTTSELTLRTRHALTITRAQAGHHDDPTGEMLDILRLVEETMGRECQFAVLVANNVADDLYRRGRYNESEAMYRRTLPVIQRLPGLHRDLLFNRHGLATVLSRQGRHDEAIAEFRSVITAATEKLGADHPYTLRSRGGLADALARQGLFDDAEAEFRATLTALSYKGATDQRIALDTRINLAEAYVRQERFAEARTEYRWVLATLERIAGPESPPTGSIRAILETLTQSNTSTRRADTQNQSTD